MEENREKMEKTEKLTEEILYIQEEFDKIGVKLTNRQASQFKMYADLLVEWNSFMNLTAITDFKEIVQKHFIDSAAYVFLPDVSRETSEEYMIDVGTGAGFPGIPLKILFPQWKIVLMDSLNKRIKFLDEVIQRLELKNIRTVHGRAEELAQKKEYREQFSLCVSRAVANLATLSEYCLPFIKKGGFLVSYKSGEVADELKNAEKAIKILGGERQQPIYFNLPGTDIQRSFIIIKKTETTPKKYPRKAGTPSKQPLGVEIIEKE